ncbi:histone-fold-containing protein [Rhodofomes roseus]|uniref:DNA polymerase epsilon subunit D n=1 Tax=Rhodofomes roseus TaxID=34475 RepID=A0ABQ8KP93_9APHY|nr:histone-fold-containing protein [Rhodofomes roseus]KAH9840146.1 histone-fold-containing protein [Rhodofomes roseus]
MAGGSKEATTSAVAAQAQQEAVSEGIETFELPRSIITKLARSAMSENTKMSKDVVLSFQKASTVFINYLAATAHEVAASKQHKSISATDVLKALELVEMGDMVHKLQQELQVYREVQKTDKGRKSTGGAKGKGRESQGEPHSVSAASAAKAKQNAKEKGPTITISRTQTKPSRRDTEPEEPEEGANGDVDGDEDEEMADEEEVEEEDDMEDEEVGDEEPEDSMAVDDKEAQGDGGGLSDGYDEEE